MPLINSFGSMSHTKHVSSSLNSAFLFKSYQILFGTTWTFILLSNISCIFQDHLVRKYFQTVYNESLFRVITTQLSIRIICCANIDVGSKGMCCLKISHETFSKWRNWVLSHVSRNLSQQMMQSLDRGREAIALVSRL